MSCTPRKNQNLTAEQCFSSTRGAQIKKKPGLQDEHRRPAAWKRRKGRRPIGRWVVDTHCFMCHYFWCHLASKLSSKKNIHLPSFGLPLCWMSARQSSHTPWHWSLRLRTKKPDVVWDLGGFAPVAGEAEAKLGKVHSKAYEESKTLKEDSLGNLKGNFLNLTARLLLYSLRTSATGSWQVFLVPICGLNLDTQWWVMVWISAMHPSY